MNYVKTVEIIRKLLKIVKFKKNIFFCTYKMVDISVENYQNAQVYTITVGNRELFWVRMIDVQNVLCIKNI